MATTHIAWNWGTNTNIDFNAATDILDFGWFQAEQFTVSEINGAVVIAIPSNQQTYTLAHTQLSELRLANIAAKDASAVTEWTDVLSGTPGTSPPMTPPPVTPPPVTPPVVTPPPVVPPGGSAPDWSATSIYTAGMMVIENGVTYKANWWTQGVDPAHNSGGGQPWTVIDGDVPHAPTAWSATSVYTAGMTAVEDGVIYQARWWTQGNDPAHNSGGAGQPWSIVGPLDPSHVDPTVPTGLAAAGTSSSATMLSWNASTVPGNGAVTGYAVFENGQQIAITAGTSYTVSNLAPDTTYAFTVAALDADSSSKKITPAAVCPCRLASELSPSMLA